MEMEIVKNDGTSKWSPNIIRYILTNVRYKGDALLQQTYTTEFLLKSVPNRGERDTYYIKNANSPIVSAELFDKVNQLLKQQARNYASNQCILPKKWVKKHDILCRVQMCVSAKARYSKYLLGVQIT